MRHKAVTCSRLQWTEGSERECGIYFCDRSFESRKTDQHKTGALDFNTALGIVDSVAKLLTDKRVMGIFIGLANLPFPHNCFVCEIDMCIHSILDPKTLLLTKQDLAQLSYAFMSIVVFFYLTAYHPVFKCFWAASSSSIAHCVQWTSAFTEVSVRIGSCLNA